MIEQSATSLNKIGRLRLVSVAAAIGILVVLAGIYGIGRLRSNPADAACRPAVNAASRIAPLVHGEVAALAMAQTPFHVPDLAFKDAQGRDKTLADWHGRTVLLNLWATWCVPVPARNAGARRAGAKARRPRFRSGRGQYRHPRSAKAAHLPQRRRREPPCLLCRSERARVRRSQKRRQSLRHADHDHRRPLRLRDRQYGRARRMGERRRREARQRGDCRLRQPT